ncbi:molybdenum cofactor biosynthesis protein B [Halobacillus sp. A5]|uniref:MogA/MoaB family molybdenum cofactor biosynthesis protein n=1 Tax=Halobacillus sp. A5 TaxID=2880263 RepID=UPI0020A64B6B|nr:MogA/MoaB family molybdenum cofactor biosynthesis protein [Halobacillus sp. A5]MCP3025436.1 MogA/MoaB family molybdenum cofactor biosynthesis protein [Halobacillus sp. A5]
MSVEQHKQDAPSTIRCMIITVSDTRTIETDRSGNYIASELIKGDHEIIDHLIVQDDSLKIKAAVRHGLEREDVDVILTNGGTGIAERDVTIETVTPLFDKEIPGFGELFRMLSYTEDIGSAAILSRAAAGVADHTAIFLMPGSSGAVKLAMNKLILPEVPHIVREVNKDL